MAKNEKMESKVEKVEQKRKSSDSIWVEVEKLAKNNKDIRSMEKITTTIQLPKQLNDLLQEKWVNYKKATGVRVSFNTFLIFHLMTVHHLEIGDSKAAPFEFRNKKGVSLERFDNYFKD